MGEEKNIDSLHVIDLSIYVFLSRVDEDGKSERKILIVRSIYLPRDRYAGLSLTSMRREGWVCNGERSKEIFEVSICLSLENTERKMCGREREKNRSSKTSLPVIDLFIFVSRQ